MSAWPHDDDDYLDDGDDDLVLSMQLWSRDLINANYKGHWEMIGGGGLEKDFILVFIIFAFLSI